MQNGFGRNSNQQKEVSIFLMDVIGFSTKEPRIQRLILQEMQKIINKTAKFFMPLGDPWAKWVRHGTGDGYYIIFDNLAPIVAYRFAMDLRNNVQIYNKNNPDFPFDLRLVLTFGDIEWVDDQLLSIAMTEAESLISSTPVKSSKEANPIAMSDLFHHQLLHDETHKKSEIQLNPSEWTLFQIKDKHDSPHKGYILGKVVSSTEQESKPDGQKPIRISILFAQSFAEPLPEAVDMVYQTINSLKDSGLLLEVSFSVASELNILKTARDGCDLLFIYGHGDYEGQLYFADGLTSYNDLTKKKEVKQLFEGLKGCFIFSCFSSTFAENLSCPWLAFDEPVYRNAPKGFMQAFVKELQTNILQEAIERALQLCKHAMTSNFTDCHTMSETPFPNIQIPKGEPRFLLTSPHLSERYRVDFQSISDEERYPDHIPFVGRAEELTSLFVFEKLDCSTVETFWVYGDPGIGKTALLRQFGESVRDLCFRDDNSPVWLLHLYCANCVQKEHVIKLICERAKELYQLKNTPSDLSGLYRVMRKVPGVHVWILDDLSYIQLSQEYAEDVHKLTASLRDGAIAEGLCLEIVASSRYKVSNSWTNIELNKLSPEEAEQLAKYIYMKNGKQLEDSERININEYYKLCQQSIVHFKRALFLILENNMTMEDYLDRSKMKGSRIDRDEKDISKRMIQTELTLLSELEANHGFRYDDFLKCYYNLIFKVDYFTHLELIEWFGEAFYLTQSGVSCEIAYLDGLDFLTKLGFMAIRTQKNERVLYMPPNQRKIMEDVSNHDIKMPDSLPFRAHISRLSQIIERDKDPWRVFKAIQNLELDYISHKKEVCISIAILELMSFRAYLAGEVIMSVSEEIEVQREIIQLFQSHSEAEVVKHVVIAYRNLGITYRDTRNYVDAIKTFKILINLFKNRKETKIVEQVSTAMVNLGFVLGINERQDEAIKVYQELINLYKNRTEAEIAVQVVIAIRNMEIVFSETGKQQVALKSYRELIEPYICRKEAEIVEQVASVMLHISGVVSVVGSPYEEIEILHEMIELYKDRSEFNILKLVLSAMYRVGAVYRESKKLEDAILAYEDMIEHSKERPEAVIAEQASKAMIIKGFTLGELKKPDDAIKAYEELIELYQDRPEAGIVKQVAMAMHGKGLTFVELGKLDDAIKAYEELIELYKDRPEVVIAESVAKAMNNKGLTFGELGKPDDAIKAYDELIELYKDRPEAGIAESVAKAMNNKAFAFSELGKPDDAIKAYEELIELYKDRPEAGIAKSVAEGRKELEILLKGKG